ncbi:FliH/SctL family protein [Ramlibacter sp. WS9]|uniref:FliH/SctL family protein n=1 Tax=Ramlibacter sp. WS9 TaxID=1882741 RepID=UPI001143383B|nr:FliH/SctL family protein [Ramlibacter sp. WS9]ROZ63192.1 hypothetical protein EEB15_30080 [Ramlibacter sp. WS9]
MKSKPTAEMPTSASVLRGIVMQSQPHALLRPGRAAGGATPIKVHPLSPPLRAEQASDATLGRKSPGYEQAFAEGREEGYAAGRATAIAEGRQSLQDAITQARVRAAEEGHLEGLASGRKEALVELERARSEAADLAKAAVEHRLVRLDDLLKGLAADLALRLVDAEDDLVALGHEAVCRVLGEEAATPAVLRSMVNHLLAQHGQRAQLAIHVHPDDLAALNEEGAPSDPAWRWVADNSVQLGGVILRSPEGSIDARLETQLAVLGETLLAVRRERKVAAP